MKSVIPIALATVAAAICSAQGRQPARGGADNHPILVEFTADHQLLAPDGALWGDLPFSNTAVPLGIDRPEGITREPAYNGTPLYGVIRLGNSSSSRFHVVVDHPKAGAWSDCRVYVDINRNGDLTDDGDGTWGTRPARAGAGAARFGPKVVPLRASYSSGRDDVEVRAEPYGVMLMYVKLAPDRPMELLYRRATARTGKIKLGDKAFKAVLVENDNDAMFLFNKGDAGKPIWLLVDEDNDGRFTEAERHDIRGGLSVAGKNFVVRPASDGSKLMLTPFDGPLPERARAGTAPRQPRVELLANGVPAPDFEALTPDGATLKLSDYRGKVVVLDFWATWCGPCIASMPSLQTLHERVADQGVAIIGLCVWDKREAFDRWLREPKVKTTYTKAFDPAGANSETQNADSIARKLYKATAIPTFYVIDRDGKIAASYVGSGQESRKGLEETLTKLGVKI